jgi:outer membrane protein assembly factor BamE (lipoprotein component of BamABCDE complex)
MNRSKRVLAAGIFLAALLPLAGCLVSGADSTRVSGTQVAPVTLQTLQEQAMTREQVIDLLGPPTRSTEIRNGEIFSYEWEKRKDGGGAVLLLFAHRHSTEEKSTAYVQFEDGVVTKTWMSD